MQQNQEIHKGERYTYIQLKHTLWNSQKINRTLFLKEELHEGVGETTLCESTWCAWRVRVQSPALTWQLTTVFNSSFRGSSSLFWPLWALEMCMVQMHTSRGNIHMHNIKINLLQIHNKYSKKAMKSQDHRLKENRRVLSNVFVTLPVLLL